MGIFRNNFDPNRDLRKVTERRTREQKWRHDRRVRPDRRLNNISVDRILFSEVTLNPTVRKASCGGDHKNQAEGNPRNEQSLVCIFKNKLGPNRDLRKVTDRRIREQKWRHDRRVHPDRRLNNISVEWIT